MIYSGTSDLASTITLASGSDRVKKNLMTVSSELTSGQKGDLVKASAGDLGTLFSIERSLHNLETEASALNNATGKMELTQTALGSIHDSLIEFGRQLLSAVERGDQQSTKLMADSAKQKLESAVSMLNVRYGRHSIFSGSKFDSPAVISADDVISDVSSIVSSSASAGDALDAIEAYFIESGGGFESNVFQGSLTNAPPVRSADGTTIEYAVRADAIAIRNSIRALAVAAVSADALVLGGGGDQTDLLREAALFSIDAADDVIELQESLGLSESHIKGESVRNNSMRGILELERASILAADPYETATKFEALQGQLQSIYTVTARLSNLTLTNFLR